MIIAFLPFLFLLLNYQTQAMWQDLDPSALPLHYRMVANSPDPDVAWRRSFFDLPEGNRPPVFKAANLYRFLTDEQLSQEIYDKGIRLMWSMADYRGETVAQNCLYLLLKKRPADSVVSFFDFLKFLVANSHELCSKEIFLRDARNLETDKLRALVYLGCHPLMPVYEEKSKIHIPYLLIAKKDSEKTVKKALEALEKQCATSNCWMKIGAAGIALLQETDFTNLGLQALRTASSHGVLMASEFGYQYFFARNECENLISFASQAHTLGNACGTYFLGEALVHQGHVAGGLPLLLESANKGESPAQARIAQYYLENPQIPQNYATSFLWLHMGAAQRNPQCQFGLGLSYLKAYGVTKDLLRAEECFRSIDGTTSALNLKYLGLGLLSEERGDKRAALEFFLEAAQKGYGEAMLKVALLLMDQRTEAPDNRGVHENILYWFKKARQEGVDLGGAYTTFMESLRPAQNDEQNMRSEHQLEELLEKSEKLSRILTQPLEKVVKLPEQELEVLEPVIEPVPAAAEKVISKDAAELASEGEVHAVLPPEEVALGAAQELVPGGGATAAPAFQNSKTKRLLEKFHRMQEALKEPSKTFPVPPLFAEALAHSNSKTTQKIFQDLTPFLPQMEFSRKALKDLCGLKCGSNDMFYHKALILLNDIMFSPCQGMGKPERLQGPKKLWSRRINAGDRLIYEIMETGRIHIHQCVGHYKD